MKELCPPCKNIIKALKKDQEYNEHLENYPINKAVEIFLKKYYQGGSKADREDYNVMVTAKDIYELNEVFMERKK
jgi:spore coat polysaccharide biosynthesis protein SpsF (cytidylyltransferase family)